MLSSNLADENRVETAAAYYEANKAEMDRGGKSYWPAFKPIDVLMSTRAEIGPRRFLVEYQGTPATPEGAEWPPDYFEHPGLWFPDWPTDGMVFKVQTLDPSKGNADNPGDYQAHIVLGLDRKGILWAECDCRREPVPEMVDRSVELARIHKPNSIVV